MIIVVLLAASAQTVKVDQFPLRSACSESAPVVAKLRAGDNVRLALDYWKQSLDIKTDPMVERTYQSALRESQTDKSGEKKFGTRFLLRYDGAVADSDTAGMMITILEEEFSRVSGQLGCRA